MSTFVRQVHTKERFKMLESACLGRSCFAPGTYQIRGAIGSGGSKDSGTCLTCMTQAYHGCPTTRPVDPTLLKRRKAEGWKTT